nr:SAM-dependent methyltransferase [Asanoa ferruginea]
MSRALYGPNGFFVSGAGPAGHFRTSANASPVLAAAVLRLLTRVDAALGQPPRLDFVDVGAGRGELLTGVLAVAPTALRDRLRPVAVEVAPRPPFLPAEIDWQEALPDRVTGLMIATEWLDNVPLDVVAGDRYVEVDPVSGAERPGEPIEAADAAWLDRWWPSLLCTPEGSTGSGATGAPRQGAEQGAAHADAGHGAARAGAEKGAPHAGAEQGAPPAGAEQGAPPAGAEQGAAHAGAEQGEPRREVGRARDEAWAGAVAAVERGLAVAVDYGHLLDARPFDGTLAGYQAGRQVAPVPDGSRDVTAHVAIDAVALAGSTVARRAYTLMTQRQALKALGADGGRPPISLAGSDPAGYVRALAAASAAAELMTPGGLGDHWWLLQPVGIDDWTWDDGRHAGSP